MKNVSDCICVLPEAEIQPFHWSGRTLAVLLASLILIFSVAQAVTDTDRPVSTHQEVLKATPSLLSAEALAPESLLKLSFELGFFFFAAFWLLFRAQAFTAPRNTSALVPIWLRNPFYIYTSINAP